MFAPFLQARLGAAARIATTAILALLLLIVGQAPARVLPALAAGAMQAGGAQLRLEAPDAWGLRPVAAEGRASDGNLESTAPGRKPAPLPAGAAGAPPDRILRGPAAAATRFRPRAPPATV